MAIDINISNYEGFLLSYIDGELREEEMSALEAFLDQHPAIRQELDLLESTRLLPEEDVVFDNKQALYKTGAVPTNMEALMLSYVDGELNSDEQKELSTFLEKRPAAQKELNLLLASKLDNSEQIVFPDKSSLYKHSRKPVYRIAAVWWGAAAAVVAGFMVWMMPMENGRQAHSHPVLADAVKRSAQVGTVPATSSVPAGVPETVQSANTRNVVAETVQPRNVKPANINHGTVAAQEKTHPESAATTAVTQSARTESSGNPQLPPPRNTTQEIMERQVAPVAAPSVALNNSHSVGIAEKETVIAAGIPTSTPAPVADVSHNTGAPGIKGELIMSVSGSDSKILDKVTNVAKFFSRKRNN
ncbi:hypothetical protein CLV59_102357 [Chitinophaga dinghuensis]|uniref:Uncharacterized protein n=1 Tax=Chitinophaga dinghuensis TaxID=1539050 RepID=A0A327W8T4_9BACT|nr:hypothetical protein [Chitinophaga dinghuensis]RAJ85652.1 hypothetical protein CLV59_102357 [Chitinophaga dinghuensis]